MSALAGHSAELGGLRLKVRREAEKMRIVLVTAGVFMFIGTGFDTDGDGDDDIYIGGRVGKGGAGDTIIFLLFGLPLLLFFASLGLVAGFWLIKMLWDMFSESGAANTVVEGAVSAFWSVVSVAFWVAMGLLCVSAIVVMLVGIFYKTKD